MNGIAQSVQLL